MKTHIESMRARYWQVCAASALALCVGDQPVAQMSSTVRLRNLEAQIEELHELRAEIKRRTAGGAIVQKADTSALLTDGPSLQEMPSMELIQRRDALSTRLESSFRYIDNENLIGAAVLDPALKHFNSLTLHDLELQATFTLAMVRSIDLELEADGLTYSIVSGLLSNHYQTQLGKPLCPDVWFRAEPRVAHCTAFRIGPKRLLTAAHCLDAPSSREAAEKGLEKYSFVANFMLRGAPLDKVPAGDVYGRGAKLVDFQYDSVNHMDWAVIDLDRPVPGGSGYQLDATPRFNDEAHRYHSFGFPFGVPMKFAYGGLATDEQPGEPWFTTTVNSFGGSSGSAIVNSVTGKVVGILAHVAGDGDDVEEGIMVDEGSSSRVVCWKPIKCIGNCRGEIAMRISSLPPGFYQPTGS